MSSFGAPLGEVCGIDCCSANESIFVKDMNWDWRGSTIDTFGTQNLNVMIVKVRYE